MRFAIWGFQTNDETNAHVMGIIENLQEHGHDIAILDSFAAILGLEHDGFSLIQADQLPADLDFILSIGGDGTLLSAAQAVMKRPIPILGINLGKLGFLTSLERDWRQGLEQLINGHYHVEERMVLNCRIEHQDGAEEVFWALNEIVIERAGDFNIIPLRVEVDESYMNTYKADGLIISTPTGSTAYALSAGGPVLDPGLDALLIMPISAHTLSVRPVVLPDDSQVTVKLVDPAGRASLHVDGKNSLPVTAHDRIVIRASGYRIQLVAMPRSSFFEKLRRKLHWGKRFEA